MTVRKHDLTGTIEYPVSDDQPFGETDLHAQLLIDLRFALRAHFRHDPRTYAAGNMLMYYVEGDATKCNAPDVFFVRGVSKEPPREIWKVWEESKAPDVIFEISSRHTWEQDLQKKWRVYEEIGVREYYIYDPWCSYLPRPLMAWRHEGGGFISVAVIQGVVQSAALGLDLVDTGETLRLRDPHTGHFLCTEAEEVERAEREAERATREAEARADAEARAARLAARLRELGIDPDQV
ncbi:MAG: Uma2 family endonuclease [Blastocatellia bacterium]